MVATDCAQPAAFQAPLWLPGVAAVAEASAGTLPELLQAVAKASSAKQPTLDGAAWLDAKYQPVPTIIEAAATLFARNSVAEIAEARAQARHATEEALQNVHRFLADNAGKTTAPAERLIVFDEAQRAWDAAKAHARHADGGPRLTMSEPAHTLDIMGRHDGWSVVVALIGNGQEINTGEAGLAEWGRVIRRHAGWRAAAAPRRATAPDPAQRLAEEKPDWLTLEDDLDLRCRCAACARHRRRRLGDAVLRKAKPRQRGAWRTPRGPALSVTRSLEACARRRCAASPAAAPGRAGAGCWRAAAAGRRARRRGAAKEVPDWFLRRWPDIRASDALETVATEYACQGLELDVVGLAWGGDFVRGRALVGAPLRRRHDGRSPRRMPTSSATPTACC